MHGRFAVVFLTVVVDMIGFGIILPLTPLYARRFGASEAVIAVLFAAYSAGQFLFAPLWGRLSDRVGRRPVLLFSIAGNCAALVVFAFADTVTGLLLARSLSGLCTANIPVAQAYCADVTEPDRRARGMGLIGAAFGIGFVVGPFIGGELSRFGPAVPPLAAAGLAALNLLSALFFLPESLPKERRQARPAQQAPRRLEVLKSVPGLSALAGIAFAQLTAFSMLEVSFTLFLNDRLGFQELEAGRVFAYIGVVLVAVQGFFVGPLARRFGEKWLVRTGLLAVALGMLAITQMPGARGQVPYLHLALLAGLITLIAGGQGITNPSLSSLLSRRAPAAMQGAALGLLQSTGALARILGPLAAGVGYKTLGASFPFLLGGILMFGAWGLAMSLLGRAPTEAPGGVMGS